MLEQKDKIDDSLDTDSHKTDTDDMNKIYEETLKSVKEGEIVKGKIIEMRPESVLIDIGYKSEGSVALSEFKEPKELKIGDEVVLIGKQDHERIPVLLPQDSVGSGVHPRTIGCDSAGGRHRPAANDEAENRNTRVHRQHKGYSRVGLYPRGQ